MEQDLTFVNPALPIVRAELAINRLRVRV